MPARTTGAEHYFQNHLVLQPCQDTALKKQVYIHYAIPVTICWIAWNFSTSQWISRFQCCWKDWKSSRFCKWEVFVRHRMLVFHGFLILWRFTGLQVGIEAVLMFCFLTCFSVYEMSLRQPDFWLRGGWIIMNYWFIFSITHRSRWS